MPRWTTHGRRKCSPGYGPHALLLTQCITIADRLFAECLGHSAKSTQQRTCRQRFLCRVPRKHSVKKSAVNCDDLFAECHVGGTRQRILSFFWNFFAECRSLALGKAGKLVICFPALPSVMVMALGKALFAECGSDGRRRRPRTLARVGAALAGAGRRPWWRWEAATAGVRERECV
jgi:hypothetical protein